MMSIRIYITSLLIVVFSSVFAYAETARVITKENAVREDCKFFSPVKAKVKYNDSIEIISKDGDWFRVKFKGVKGCIHKSAIEEKTFRFTGLSGSQTQSASGDEVSLAGKGFNPQVESSYKSKHPELDFKTVDRIEEYKITEESIKSFIKNGGLNLPQ